jgi:hypothetical protein
MITATTPITPHSTNPKISDTGDQPRPANMIEPEIKKTRRMAHEAARMAKPTPVQVLYQRGTRLTYCSTGVGTIFMALPAPRSPNGVSKRYSMPT